MSVNVDRSLELPTSEYYAEPQVKSGIVLHTQLHAANVAAYATGFVLGAVVHD